MKGFVLWVLFLVAGTSMAFPCFSTAGSNSLVPDTALTRHGDDLAVMVSSRKLKENGHASSADNSDEGTVNVEDYDSFDPVPSSKASVRPGPIEHGTPLMPYIPRPSPPPDQPKHSGFP